MGRLLPLLLWMAGCAHPAAGPNSAVRGWLTAQSKDDPHAAYRLLAKSLRERIPSEEFAARWRAHPEERKAQATALGPLANRPPLERARALWSDTREAELVHDPTGWRIASPRMGAGGAANPGEALRRFANALQHHDLDGLLDLMGDPLRSLLERELADRLARLKSAMGKEIQVDGQRARIRLDERYYLELRQENGRWRISDFN